MMKKAIQQALEILRWRGLTADEKALKSHYRKIYRGMKIGGLYPFHTAVEMAQMAELNGDVFPLVDPSE